MSGQTSGASQFSQEPTCDQLHDACAWERLFQVTAASMTARSRTGHTALVHQPRKCGRRVKALPSFSVIQEALQARADSRSGPASTVLHPRHSHLLLVIIEDFCNNKAERKHVGLRSGCQESCTRAQHIWRSTSHRQSAAPAQHMPTHLLSL